MQICFFCVASRILIRISVMSTGTKSIHMCSKSHLRPCRRHANSGSLSRPQTGRNLWECGLPPRGESGLTGFLLGGMGAKLTLSSAQDRPHLS